MSPCRAGRETRVDHHFSNRSAGREIRRVERYLTSGRSAKPPKIKGLVRAIGAAARTKEAVTSRLCAKSEAPVILSRAGGLPGLADHIHSNCSPLFRGEG